GFMDVLIGVEEVEAVGVPAGIGQTGQRRSGCGLMVAGILTDGVGSDIVGLSASGTALEQMDDVLVAAA
ncbi:MAG TPA: hypothetical protein VI685_16540, partial [Candidatus Angelobacter sp.]